MGNSQLIRVLTDIGVTDISTRGVVFQDGLFQARAIFQRHNYQLYQVNCPDESNPLGISTQTNLTLRVIRCLNDPESIQILKDMQERVINLKQHKNLVRSYVMALVAEDYNQKQKAGLIGLPGLYKSVAGTTDYKTDTIQFILVEEDHLSMLQPQFFGPNQPPPAANEVLRQKFTLKQFMDRILPNSLLIDLFTEDQTTLYQLIIQVLEALAYLNEQGMTHQDLTPQSIFFELVSPYQVDQFGNFLPVSNPNSNDFHERFRIKLGEYLNIKMLSDIAFQKTMLLQMQAKMAQERTYGGSSPSMPNVNQVVQQIRENKQLYSQYDPPEKLKQNSIEMNPKSKNSKHLEDYDIKLIPLRCENQSSDIWSLGIVILEIYLSLFIHKKDCREMVHNLYLNKLSYQSRCIIINEILDNNKNPIFCSLMKEMLRDCEPEVDDPMMPVLEDDASLYEDLIQKSNKTQNKRNGARPTAAHLLSRNRIIHYFSYVSDNKIDNKYLPNDINLLQVFSSNEMFVPMLVQCGMQNVLNKNKGIICFFTAMTVFIKTKANATITELITQTVIQSKAHLQIIELLNFCMNSDLRQIMMFFNQNLIQSDFEDLDINESIFHSDFVEQKQAGLELLIHIIQIHQQDPDKNLAYLLHDYLNAGLVPLVILLIQKIKNQKWMREKKLFTIKQEEMDDRMTEFTLQIIELMCQFGAQGYSKSFAAFIDKIEFFIQVCEILCSKKPSVKDDAKVKNLLSKDEVSKVMNGQNGKSFIERDQQSSGQRQAENDRKPLRSRRFSQKRPTIHDRQKINTIEDQAAFDEQQRYGVNSVKTQHGSVSRHNYHNKTQNFDEIDQTSQGSETQRTAREEDKQHLTQEQRLKINQAKYKDRLFDFVIKCSECISEMNLKKILDIFQANNKTDMLLQFLISPAMKGFAQTCSLDFKRYITEMLMKKFLNLHLKTNKTIAGSSNFKQAQNKQNYQSSFATAKSGINNDQMPMLSARAFGTTSNQLDNLNPAILSPSNRFQTQTDQMQRNQMKGSSSRNKLNPQWQADFMNQTYTSQKSYTKRSNQTPNAANRADGSAPPNVELKKMNCNLSQSERQMCQISQILKFYVDSSESADKAIQTIQTCVDHQECISRYIQRTQSENWKYAMYKQQQKKNKTALEINNRLEQESDPPRGAEKRSVGRTYNRERDEQQRRHAATFSPLNTYQVDQMQSSGRPQTDLDNQANTENFGMLLKPMQNKMFAPCFFQCCSVSCENQIFCLVCALKFHQDHKDLKPYINTKSEDLTCYTTVLRESMDPSNNDLDYMNQSLLWNYEVDQYSRIENVQSIQSELNLIQKNNAQSMAKTAQGTSLGVSTSSASIPVAQRNKNKKSIQGGPDSKVSSVVGFGGNGANEQEAPKKVEFETLLNFDHYDKGAVFVEGQAGVQPNRMTHFLTNDFEQHSLICSSPLDLPDNDGAPLGQQTTEQFIENYKQSYFEVKIHSGGFYDQIQIGLIFILEKDIVGGRNSSSNLLNSLMNYSMIPGYEPLSIGYHGDDGQLYHNLSQNVCLETLILRASQDAEQLLQDAETDESLFDISNQIVYGGAYGPTFGAGDHIGCGIIPIQNTNLNQFNQPDEECAIFFTINGLKLPAIKIKSQGVKFFPVLSMKGKLCHIEMLRSVQDYAFNRLLLIDLEHQRLITQIRQNEKFMRSLTQFGQILNLKNKRAGTSSGQYAVDGQLEMNDAMPGSNDDRDGVAGASNNLTERSRTRDQGRDGSKNRGTSQSMQNNGQSALPSAPELLFNTIKLELELLNTTQPRPSADSAQMQAPGGGMNKPQSRHLAGSNTRSNMPRANHQNAQISGQGNVVGNAAQAGRPSGPGMAGGPSNMMLTGGPGSMAGTSRRHVQQQLPPQAQGQPYNAGSVEARQRYTGGGAGVQAQGGQYLQIPNNQIQNQGLYQGSYNQELHHNQSQPITPTNPHPPPEPSGHQPSGPPSSSYWQPLQNVQSISKQQQRNPNLGNQGPMSGSSTSFAQNQSSNTRGGMSRGSTKGGVKNFVKENRLKVSRSQAKF